MAILLEMVKLSKKNTSMKLTRGIYWYEISKLYFRQRYHNKYDKFIKTSGI